MEHSRNQGEDSYAEGNFLQKATSDMEPQHAVTVATEESISEAPINAEPSSSTSGSISSNEYEGISEDLLDFVKQLDEAKAAASEEDFLKLFETRDSFGNWPIWSPSLPLPTLDYKPIQVPDHPLTYEEIVNQPGFRLESLTYLNSPNWKKRVIAENAAEVARLKSLNNPLPAISFLSNEVKKAAKKKVPNMRPQPNWCKFCKSNGETPDFFGSHQLKTPDGIVSCPVLRKFTCPICNSCGDAAHTIKYCPELMVRQMELARIGWDLPGDQLYQIQKNSTGVSKNVIKYF